MPKRKMFSIWIPKDMKKRLMKQASRKAATISGTIRTAILEHLEKEESKRATKIFPLKRRSMDGF